MSENTGGSDLRAMVPYIAPMVAYLLGSQVESMISEGHQAVWYPIAYTIKLLAVLGILTAGRSILRDLKPLPNPRGWVLAVVIGLAVTVAWVGLDPWYPRFAWLGGDRAGFDPSTLEGPARSAFLAVRLAGLVLLVPVFEELFWRSFVVRLVIDPDDFRRVPIGRLTWLAAGVSSVGFALGHPEWLPALLTGAVWAWLLHHTKSLSACVVSHAVANLALGIYVLSTGDWRFW